MSKKKISIADKTGSLLYEYNPSKISSDCKIA